MPLLSVIVPAYNEFKTIRQILGKIQMVSIDKEIIVVDDSSTDGTDAILRGAEYNSLKIIHHTSNRGKGAAFLTGLMHAQGEFVIVQDADLEYDPACYPQLFDALRTNNADMVLGARFLKGHHGLWLHRIGNRFLTFLLNFLFGSSLNDYATCYKLAKRTTFQELHLKAAGFEIDVEMVASALKRHKRIIEAPVSYTPRSYHAGKKIRLSDGMRAIFAMLKYRIQK